MDHPRLWQWGVLVAVAGLLLGACGGGGGEKSAGTSTTTPRSNVVHDTVSTVTEPTTTTTPRQDLVVQNKGFTAFVVESIHQPYLTFAAIIRNPNSDWMARSVKVNLSFYDANGGVTHSASEDVFVILPGQVVAVGDISSGGAGTTRVEVQVLAESWEASTSLTGSFTAEGVAVRPRGQYDSSSTAVGQIRSTFQRDFKKPKAVAVFYGRNGQIAGGAYTYVDFIPANGQVGVEVSASFAPSGITKADIFVALTILSFSDS